MSLLMVAMIVEKYGPRLNVEQLSEIFDLEPNEIYRQVSLGTFPVVTYVDSGKRFADCRDVAAYLDACREAARKAVDSGQTLTEFLKQAPH